MGNRDSSSKDNNSGGDDGLTSKEQQQGRWNDRGWNETIPKQTSGRGERNKQRKKKILVLLNVKDFS